MVLLVAGVVVGALLGLAVPLVLREPLGRQGRRDHPVNQEHPVNQVHQAPLDRQETLARATAGQTAQASLAQAVTPAKATVKEE